MQDNYKVGDFYELEHVFNEKDVILFSKLSLDENPIHLDEEYAKTTIFGKRIVHGLLVSSLFSGVIANKLLGKGSIYLSQNLSFKKPVFLNQKIRIRVEIKSIRDDKPIFTLSTSCFDEDSNTLINGDAVILKK